MIDVRPLAEVAGDTDAVAQWAFAGEQASWPHAGFLADAGFCGQLGESAVLPRGVREAGGGAGEPGGGAAVSGGAAVRIVVGAGPRGELDTVALRRAGAGLARATRRCRRVAVEPPEGEADAGDRVGALVEGFLLASYRFDRHRSARPDAPTERLDILAPGHAAASRAHPVAAAVAHAQPVAAAVARARCVAAAVAMARDLGNEPGGVLTPSEFADRAAEVATRGRVGCEVWDEHRMGVERLGGLLGVSRGSDQPARLVRLDYRPAGPPVATFAVVGKGVTFDAGGLSLKPTKQMQDMKIDMAGAAAVLGAMSALPDLGCAARVVGWLPLTENMPGGGATRLGDVLRTRNGTTVEVRNADAEGRLILADALALACEERPDAVVDVATLTAAIAMAVGRRYAGLAGNDEAWQASVRAAAERAGEPVWPLPLDGADRGQLRSKVADLANVPGGGDGQSVAAALFLRQFVPPDIPWAHLDINGPAFSDIDDGELVPGATGYGVRTLLELFLGVSAHPYT